LGSLQILHHSPLPAAQHAEQASLLSLEEYFNKVGQDVSGALVVDGRYHGWASPAVCERYGVAGSADEAWEANGGGKFTFKIDKKGEGARRL
jgi:hypothetical protein